MPYVPYARQDRAMVSGDAFSLKVFANILNSLKFDCVEIIDPHSDVTPALIDNVFVIEQHKCYVLESLGGAYDAIVSPDGGALKKIFKAAKVLNVSFVIEASKNRDVVTGAITSTSFIGDVSGKKLLIVDDICDGVFTFIKLAEVLKAGGAKQVDLYVTHGIFSKGIEVLTPFIDNVYCQYSWITPHPILNSPNFI